MFTVNYDDAQEFQTVQDGDYQVIINKFEEGATIGGAEFIDVRLRIRSDFDQKFKNNLVFHRIFKSKETGKYPDGVLQNWFKQTQVPNGTKISTFDDVTKLLVGRSLLITVKNETTEYNGKTYHNTNVKRIQKSDLPHMQPVATEDVAVDDLPF